MKFFKKRKELKNRKLKYHIDKDFNKIDKTYDGNNIKTKQNLEQQKQNFKQQLKETRVQLKGLYLKFIAIFFICMLVCICSFLFKFYFAIFKIDYNNLLLIYNVACFSGLIFGLLIYLKQIKIGINKVLNNQSEKIVFLSIFLVESLILCILNILSLYILKFEQINTFVLVGLINLTFFGILQILEKKQKIENLRVFLRLNENPYIMEENIEENLPFSIKKEILAQEIKLEEENEILENHSRKIIITCEIFCIIIAVLALAFKKDAIYSINSLMLSKSLILPVFIFLPASLRKFKTHKISSKKGIVFNNLKSIFSVAKTNSVYLSEKDLYAPENIALCTLKTYKAQKLDIAVLAAAQITKILDSPLYDMLSKIISGSKHKFNKISEINFEENLGINAWVDGQQILMGNRDLLKKFGAKRPLLEEEQILKNNNKDIIYIAISGEIIVALILEYKINSRKKALIKKLSDKNIKFIVSSCENNITKEKIQKDFTIPSELLTVLSFNSKKQQNKTQHITENKFGQVFLLPKVECFLESINLAKNLSYSLIATWIIQNLCIFIGCSLIVFLLIFQNLDQIHSWQILSYYFIWILIGFFIPKFKDF